MRYLEERVLENVEISKGIFELTIKGNFQGEAGQFYLLRAWDREPLLSRPISIHEVLEDKISFIYQVVGKGTEILSKLKPEDSIEITGPLGNGFDTSNIKGNIAVVAGGVGIAPMKQILKELATSNKDIAGSNIDFFCGFRSEVYLTEELKQYADNINLSTEDGTTGHKGYITEIFNPSKYDMVLCCGPEVMMVKVVNMCKTVNVPIWVSMETHMACGVGACLVCTCKAEGLNKRCCTDGPVFLGETLEF
jgi:dihydroorotate dehydrogenase electron transfer subunit